MRIKNRSTVLLMLATAGFLIIIALWNCLLFLRPAWNLIQGKSRFSSFTEQVRTQYTEDFSAKYSFINLNGWFAGKLDQTTCNEVVKLKNGMLATPTDRIDSTSRANSVIELKDFLAEDGIDFLYICAPYKIDLEKELLPEGIEDYGNENADDLIALLRDGGVQVMDLRPEFSATPEQVDQNFFRTDHHWNFIGSFFGIQRIGAQLQQLYPERNLDLSYADFSQWESHELKNWFLGSRGKRVGLYFGGVDDVTYYTPKFPTNLSCAIPNHAWLFKGDFTEAAMRMEHTKHPDYFEGSSHNIYVGGNYPIVQYRNPDAPNDLRILMVCDSYSKAPQSQFATMFQEIDVIDLRRFNTDFNLAEYARFWQPDIVIQMHCPSSINTESLFQFNVKKAMEKPSSPVSIPTLPQDVTVTDSDAGHLAIPAKLERNRSYILRLDDIEIDPSSEGAAIGLYDIDKNTTYSISVFDVEYCRTHSGFQWFFSVSEDASDNLEFRFCAGVPKNLAQGDVVYRGIRLDAVA